MLLRAIPTTHGIGEDIGSFYHWSERQMVLGPNTVENQEY